MPISNRRFPFPERGYNMTEPKLERDPMTGQQQMFVRNTITVAIGVVIGLVSLLLYVTITGNKDASVNQTEYVHAVQACHAATPSNVTLCITNVDQHFSDNSSGS
jgi:hypothetical protein